MFINDIEKKKRKQEDELTIESGTQEQESIVIHCGQARSAYPYLIPHSRYLRFYRLGHDAPRAHIRAPNRDAISGRRAKRYVRMS